MVACTACGTKNRVPVAAQGHPRCASCKQALPWLVDAGDRTFDEAVDTSLLVVLDLWAPWCGPCRMVSPALETLARERAGRIKLVKVNVDNSPLTQAQFRVQSIPTLIIFDKGRTVAQQSGALPLNKLRSWVDRSLGA